MTSEKNPAKNTSKSDVVAQKPNTIKTKTKSTSSAPKKAITGPTYLTILRMILSVAFMFFVLFPDMWAKVVALVVFVVASITDKIDGNWARSQGLVTDLGAFLDPLADKMLVDLAFLAMVQINVVPIWVFALILVRDLAIDGMRMMIARNGVTVSASYFGKLKTTFQMTALIILQVSLIFQVELFSILGYIALYLALILTLVSGADYMIKGWPKITNN